MASGDAPKHPPVLQNQAAEPAPDPDEDDLDDLDGKSSPDPYMLDEFSALRTDTSAPAQSTITTKAPAPASSGPGRPAAPSASTAAAQTAGDSKEEEDFAAQLQAGMAEMLRELEANPDLAKQFEAMMGGALPGLSASGASASVSTVPVTAPASSVTTAPAPAGAAKPGEDTFQETIRRTMERMQSSSASAARASDTAATSEEDMMAALMAQMGAGGMGDGEGGDDAFSKMLLGMMEQLTNKDILYEPMKELQTKFPAWLAERGQGGAKKGEVAEDEMTRYREQARLASEIVGRFERRGYSDGNAADREYIVERMQKMQAAGAPPAELVGDLGSAQEMMGDMDAGCPQQ